MGAEFIFCSLCFGLDFQTKRQNQGPNLCYPLLCISMHSSTAIVRTYVPLLLCLVGFGSLFILVGVHSFAVYRFRCLWNQVQLLSGDTTSARSASSRDPRDQKSQGVGERRQQQRNQNMCWICGLKNSPIFSLRIDLLSFGYELIHLINNCLRVFISIFLDSLIYSLRTTY